MRLSAYLTILAAPLALAACGSGDEASETAEATATDGMATADQMSVADDMPMMQSGEAGQTASGEGTVTAVDAEEGKITIDHGPIPAVDWPAMRMAFEADEALRQQIAVGDEVAFEFRTTEGGGQITSITKK